MTSAADTYRDGFLAGYEAAQDAADECCGCGLGDPEDAYKRREEIAAARAQREAEYRRRLAIERAANAERRAAAERRAQSVNDAIWSVFNQLKEEGKL